MSKSFRSVLEGAVVIPGIVPFGRSARIPNYVLALAAKRRGVRTHYNADGLAKRQVNYFMHEAQ